jgi:hypothetical protein
VAEEDQRSNDQDDEDRLDYKWKMSAREAKKKYHEGRRGDHLMVSFECDLCISRKLTRRDPVLRNAKDNLLLMSIRSLAPLYR